MLGGYKVVARDCVGQFVAGATGQTLRCASSVITEALALQQGRQLGLQLGLSAVA